MAARRGKGTGGRGGGRRGGSFTGWLGFLLIIGVVLACSLAAVVGWRQAAAVCTYAAADAPSTTADTPIWQRLWSGEPIPKPQSKRDPSAIDQKFEVERFGTAEGVELEGWRIRRKASSGVVLLFGDHGQPRDALLAEASALLNAGWEVLLLDTRRAGGSVGGRLSLGWHESEDVRAAFERERLRTDHVVVLYGRGSAAAAILRAVQDSAIKPGGLILERPFDSLRSRMRALSVSRGLPPIPMGTISAFWVGFLRNLPAFEFAPSAWAAEATMPALVLADGGDPTGAASARKVHDHLAGAKHWQRFDAGPVAGLPPRWQVSVGAFLASLVKGSPSGTAEEVDAGVRLPGARPPVRRPTAKPPTAPGAGGIE